MTGDIETNTESFIERMEDAYKQALTVGSFLEVLRCTNLTEIDEGHLSYAIDAIAKQSGQASTMIDELTAVARRILNTALASPQTMAIHKDELDTHCEHVQKAYELVEMAVQQREAGEEGRRETLIEEAYKHMISAGQSMSDMRIEGAS